MKVGMAVERRGVPVGVLTDAANVGEPDLGERVLGRLPVGVEVPADVPVVADRGFDCDTLRDDRVRSAKTLLPAGGSLGAFRHPEESRTWPRVGNGTRRRSGSGGRRSAAGVEITATDLTLILGGVALNATRRMRFAGGRIVEVACWAHARRKFVEAAKTSPALAREAVARIRQLYAIEHGARDLDALARAARRQAKARPVLDALKPWLDRQRAAALPKTPIAEALTYAANQWDALTVYLRDGDLAIDNNAAERALKPFCLGRKNWLFFGSDRGGRTLATLCSFTATCELRAINPWTWLRDTLTRLPTTPSDQLPGLLPTK